MMQIAEAVKSNTANYLNLASYCFGLNVRIDQPASGQAQQASGVNLSNVVQNLRFGMFPLF